MIWDGRPAFRRLVGTVVGTPSAANLAITFPTPFPAGVTPVVLAAPGDNASGLRDVVVVAASVTASGFAVQCWNDTGGAISGGPVRINYIAEVV